MFSILSGKKSHLNYESLLNFRIFPLFSTQPLICLYFLLVLVIRNISQKCVLFCFSIFFLKIVTLQNNVNKKIFLNTKAAILLS